MLYTFEDGYIVDLSHVVAVSPINNGFWIVNLTGGGSVSFSDRLYPRDNFVKSLEWHKICEKGGYALPTPMQDSPYEVAWVISTTTTADKVSGN